MKFSQVMVKEALERSALKLAVVCLSTLSLIFSILLALDLSKEPIVVERACESKVLEISSSAQTKEEIMSFVKDAVALRFDTSASRDPSAFLAQDLFVARTKEQEELKRGGVDQRIIVRSIRMDKDIFTVEADRVVALGKARSAIPILLVARVSSKGRSLTNPYGLVLTAVDQVKEAKRDE